MSLKDDLRRYVEGWEAVEKIEAEEQRSTTIEQRWNQLNAVRALGVILGFTKPDSGELEVYEIWGRLKEKLIQKTSSE
jgi:hypothetical protein